MKQSKVSMTVLVMCAMCGAGDTQGTNSRRALFPPSPLTEVEHSSPKATPSEELSCKKRLVEVRLQHEDSKGRRCWGNIAATICVGRCDSHEVSEWRFPWKKWKHPVCGFGGRTLSMVLLEECDEGADQDARVVPLVRATSCVCRPCQAAATSCLPLTSPPQSYHVDILLPDVDSI